MLSVDGGEIKCKVWRWGATQRKQTLISNILFYRLNDSLRGKKKKKKFDTANRKNKIALCDFVLVSVYCFDLFCIV